VDLQLTNAMKSDESFREIAEALWKLERNDEARPHARSAVDASPTDDRGVQLSDQLRHIVATGWCRVCERRAILNPH
jgi:hypothetical protein